MINNNFDILINDFKANALFGNPSQTLAKNIVIAGDVFKSGITNLQSEREHSLVIGINWITLKIIALKKERRILQHKLLIVRRSKRGKTKVAKVNQEKVECEPKPIVSLQPKIKSKPLPKPKPKPAPLPAPTCKYWNCTKKRSELNIYCGRHMRLVKK